MAELRRALLGATMVGVVAAIALERPTQDAIVAKSPVVYVGDVRVWERAAVVRADDVYLAIPEYRRIRDEDLRPETAEYELLMAKASARFVQAVRAAARSEGYDLVAERGTSPLLEEAPDITDSVLEKL